MNYTNIFKEMVESLKANSHIHINHFLMLDANLNNIVEVENKLGYELDQNIKDFYSECGGIQLVWTHKANSHYEALKQFNENNQQLDYEWGYIDYCGYDGSIMIPPIQEVFLSEWYDVIYFDFTIEDRRTIVFDGNEYIEPDFSKRIKPFDRYSQYHDMAFFLDGTSNPKLILGDDHQACYTDSRLITFTDYMKFLIYSKGATEARSNFFSKYNGHALDTVNATQIDSLPPIDFSTYVDDRLFMPFEGNYWSSKE